jgi:hypothetical protein
VSRLVDCGTLALALSQAACQALSDGARDKFSVSFTCPTDRVEVRERPDLHPSDWLKVKPSSEIAADPGRLKMWQADQDRLKSYTDGRYHIFEARGCGHESLYECARARQSYNTLVIQASCSRLDYQPSMGRW